MSTEQADQKLYQRAHEIVLSQGLEMVELKVGRHNKEVFIQILADRPQGGITIQECTLLNRHIVEAIDKEGIFNEDGYSLEVSSPGLDRPLVTYKDFLRNLNREVNVWLKEKIGEKTECSGIIKSADTQGLVLLSTTKNQKEIVIPTEKIDKGLLIV